MIALLLAMLAQAPDAAQKPPKPPPPQTGPSIDELVPKNAVLAIVARTAPALDRALAPVAVWMQPGPGSLWLVRHVAGVPVLASTLGTTRAVGMFASIGADHALRWTLVATPERDAPALATPEGWKRIAYDSTVAWTEEPALEKHAPHPWGHLPIGTQAALHANLRELRSRDEACVRSFLALLEACVPVGVEDPPHRHAPADLLRFVARHADEADGVDVELNCGPPSDDVFVAWRLAQASPLRATQSSTPHGLATIERDVDHQAPAWLVAACDPAHRDALTTMRADWSVVAQPCFASEYGAALSLAASAPRDDATCGAVCTFACGIDAHGGWSSLAFRGVDAASCASLGESTFAAAAPPSAGRAEVTKLDDGEQRTWHAPITERLHGCGDESIERSALQTDLARRIVGADGPLRSITRRGALVTWATGEDPSLHDAIAHARPPEKPWPDVASAIAAVEGLDPAYAGRIDYAELSRGFYAMLETVSGGETRVELLDDAGEAPVVEISGGLAQDAWRIQIRTPVRALLRPWSVALDGATAASGTTPR